MKHHCFDGATCRFLAGGSDVDPSACPDPGSIGSIGTIFFFFSSKLRFKPIRGGFSRGIVLPPTGTTWIYWIYFAGMRQESLWCHSSAISVDSSTGSAGRSDLLFLVDLLCCLPMNARVPWLTNGDFRRGGWQQHDVRLFVQTPISLAPSGAPGPSRGRRAWGRTPDCRAPGTK